MKISVAIGFVGFLFCWLGGLVALVVAAPFLWKLEHHFFFGRQTVESAPSDPDAARGSGSGPGLEG
ncbi:MAG: hypothetical protein Q7V57_00430 [Actinomycetota bacterium]|nr:hypothetical protein [Actinomycetota bacterium]